MSTSKRKVFLLGNPQKSEVARTLPELAEFAAGSADVVGCDASLDGTPAIREGADRIIVLGGDGTLLGVSRSLGSHQIPLIGVNMGKLGFLAEFTIDEVRDQFEQAVYEDVWIDERTIIEVDLFRADRREFNSLCINDCVVQAGAPFRLISLSISLDGRLLTDTSGDGIILCTPNGSTGHNLSAGGPILQSELEAIVMTPLCPHSLTHRPMVLDPRVCVEVVCQHVNDGTMLIVDGQVSYPVQAGDRLRVRQHEARFRLVHNARFPKWHKLVTKLGWGRNPATQMETPGL